MSKTTKREAEIEKLNDRLITAREYFAQFAPKELSVLDQSLTFH